MPSILHCIFIVLFLSSCGTQDYNYGERSNSAEEEAVVEDDTLEAWREQALRTREDDPAISRGEMEELDTALSSAIPYSENCPSEFICVSNPYIGSLQFGKLAALYPEHFQLSGEGHLQNFSVVQIPRLLIRTDILELDSGERIQFCGDELKVFSSEMGGEGIIDGSASNCEKGEFRFDGANIQILTGTIEGIQIISNGRDGDDGQDGVVNWDLFAPDGDPNAVRVQSETTYKDVNVCADIWSCRETYQKEIRGRDIHEIATAQMEWMDNHYEWLEARGLKRSMLEEHLAKAEAALKDEGAYVPQLTNCWIRSKKGVGRETGLIDSIQVSMKGMEGLNGKDAKYKSEGTSGGHGGNSGAIEVVTMSAKIPKPVGRAGKPGKAGKSFVQQPGQGAESKDSFYAWSGRFFGWFECLHHTGKTKRENGKTVPVIGPYYKVALDLEFEETLSLEKLKRGIHIKNLVSLKNFKGFGSIRGTGGNPLQVDHPDDGEGGIEHLPNVIVTESGELLARKAEIFCSACELPSVFLDLFE